MELFDPPDVEKMKAKRDVEGLIKALGYQKDTNVRKTAAEALGQIGDAHAVELLIALLKDSDPDVRKEAVIALGKIGDARAAAPLITAFKDSNSRVRYWVAYALNKINWQPGQDEIGAAYWVVKREWEKCIEIGAPAVEPLIVALKDSNSDVRWAAAGALEKIGVRIKDAALVLRVVEPLIEALKGDTWSARKGAAEALVRLYQSGLIDETHKSIILTQRGSISANHDDGRYHSDVGGYSDCSNRYNNAHTDNGIGVAFPI